MSLDIETLVGPASPFSVLLSLTLLWCLALLLVLGPIGLLTLLAAIADILALATLLQFSSSFKLVIGLVTTWTLAARGEEVVRGTIILVMLEGNFELFLHWATEAGVGECPGVPDDYRISIA